MTVRLSRYRRSGAGESPQKAKSHQSARGKRRMNSLQLGFAPKMKPISPKQAGDRCGALDVGTSKVVCMIARLEPRSPQDVLRRRSHSVEIIGFGHVEARGMKSGNVADLEAADHGVRQAIDHCRAVSVGASQIRLRSRFPHGRLGSERFTASVDVVGPSVSRRTTLPGCLRREAAIPAGKGASSSIRCRSAIRHRWRSRHPRSARHASASLRSRYACGHG